MQITQSYTQASVAKSNSKGTHFDFSAELSRKSVSLHAMIKHSLSYAKLMLALRRVVISDLANKEQDHSRYQAWVQNEYYKELPTYLANIAPIQKELLKQKKELSEKHRQLVKDNQPYRTAMWDAQRNYRSYIWKHEKEKAYLLDPVISVHPDSVIFEAFSIDESTYARVSVPSENLETFGEVNYGTTNIDFSQGLADEIYRVRSYRPAWLKVAQHQVKLSTSSGAKVEKKIDLPESWVKGFLQVQSAAALNGQEVRLSAATLREILGYIEQKKAKQGPRSLRFILKKGEKPTIIIDPWGIEVKEQEHVFDGDFEGEIRIWGRRRLLILTDALPVIDQVNVKLLGTGMPSFWSVQLDGHQLDLGLSGWTSNDWARKSSFDLLAGQMVKDQKVVDQTEKWLKTKLAGKTKDLAKALETDDATAGAALQQLCKEGKAMYDPNKGMYRWRDLFPVGVRLEQKDDQHQYAKELIANNKVKKLIDKSENQLKHYEFEVEGKKVFRTIILQDSDGRIKRASCTCGFYKHNKLRKGPCAHIAASLMSI